MFYKKEVLRIGITNLGNTCYLNSSLQILNRIDEFKEFMTKKLLPGSQSINEKLALSLKDVFIKLENSGQAFEPTLFLGTFFKAFPQFAEKDDHGHGFKQQDADECFQLLLSELEPVFNKHNNNLVNDLFTINYKVSFFNKETNQIEGQETLESSRKLTCIIDNQLNPINTLSEGIQLGLEDAINKNSESLGRNCDFTKKSRLINLPKYLIVQKIRFVWREKDAMTNTEARKAKILRNVSFPKILDTFEFCDQELQKNLTSVRTKELEFEENKKKESQLAYEKYKKEQGLLEEDNYKVYKKFKQEEKKKEDLNHDKKLWAPFEQGQPTGNYELVGVITHKGRSSDSGHYVSWTQLKGDLWLKFDDDVVSEVTIDEIMNLRGGGDWHMAYYLIYRRLDFII